MKKYFLIFLSAVILLSMFSCGGDKDLSINDLKFEMVKYEKQSDDCDSLLEDNCAQIKIEFPQITEFENPTVKEKINKSIVALFSHDGSNAGQVDFETEMKNFIEDYEDFIKEFPDSYQSWFIEKTSEVKFNKGNIFSIDFMEYSFTGGAHPNTYLVFKNFNLNNGEEVKLDELISKDKQQELTKIAEAEFRKRKELTSEADLGEAGYWFENNEFYLNENFLITDSSLVFFYNNYEITAYAFGPTELEIPYSKLRDIVKDDSIISKLLNNL